ncbi:MAG TPA: response regulator transcription factor [Blastocatellia bacterium]|nr:response regulator transcription factor [Blastocatellia bacterium]
MPTPICPIRLLIADDHPLLRAGLRQAIATDPHLEIIAEAADGAMALELLTQHQPDVAVLDIEMPNLTGFALLRELRAQRLPTAVVFLTMYHDEEMFNEALDLGALGYVLKDSTMTDITGAIRAAANGQPFISPAISAYLFNRAMRSTTLTQQVPALNALTLTERRILKLIAENKTSKEIGAELFISYRTVENHRTNICQKLDLKGSHSLLKFAFDHKTEL